MLYCYQAFQESRIFFRCLCVTCFPGNFVFLCQLMGQLHGKPHKLVSQTMTSQGTGLPSNILSGVEPKNLSNLDLVSGVVSALLFPSVASDQQMNFRGLKCKSSEQSSCSLEYTLWLKTKVKVVKACEHTNV